MTAPDKDTDDEVRKQPRAPFDRHVPEYRYRCEKPTRRPTSHCPFGRPGTYGRHRVAAVGREAFALAVTVRTTEAKVR